MILYKCIEIIQRFLSSRAAFGVIKFYLVSSRQIAVSAGPPEAVVQKRDPNQRVRKATKTTKTP